MSDPTSEPGVTVCAVRETAPGEQRVALVPESVPVLARARVHVLVESGAGEAACFPDSAYERAGAEVVSRNEAIDRADILVGVGTPAPELLARLRDGQAVIGMLRPLVQPGLVRQLAGAGVTAISLDGLPRTVSRAQSMDALTSQANVAGYKAVLVAADNFGRFFPMLITAAGTSRPATVLVLGAGVAGLQAMGTARRLGAVVTGYDIRPETRWPNTWSPWMPMTMPRPGGLLSKLITPKRLSENEEFIWRLADQQIDKFLDRGACEFMEDYAKPLSMLVIADLLGVPVEDHREFRAVLGNEHVGQLGRGRHGCSQPADVARSRSSTPTSATAGATPATMR